MCLRRDVSCVPRSGQFPHEDCDHNSSYTKPGKDSACIKRQRTLRRLYLWVDVQVVVEVARRLIENCQVSLAAASWLEPRHLESSSVILPDWKACNRQVSTIPTSGDVQTSAKPNLRVEGSFRHPSYSCRLHTGQSNATVCGGF